MEAVIFGAGNIGRGFIGQLFCQAGYHSAFIDVDASLIDLLNSNNTYPLSLVSPNGNFTEHTVENFCGINALNTQEVVDAVANCDIMATAVGAGALSKITPAIALGLIKRRQTKNLPLDILICENLVDSSSFLRDLLLKELPDDIHQWFNQNIGLVEASIGRMVPVQTDEMKKGNPLRILSEPYDTLPVDKDAFKTQLPPIKTLAPYSPFSFYIRRKLFVHNMLHSLTAYLGDFYGDEFIWQAIARPEVSCIVSMAAHESCQALSKMFNEDLSALLEHADDLLFRFSNKWLGDTVARVGRDLRRKLAPNDRLVGPLLAAKEAGIKTCFLNLGIALALHFSGNELELTPEETLLQICMLDSKSEDFERILNLYDEIEKGTALESLCCSLT